MPRKQTIMEENFNQLWIARDKNGQLCVYRGKPIRADYGFVDSDLPAGIRCLAECVAYSDNYVEIPKDMYPEITFENSPQLLIPKTEKNNNEND